MFKQTTETLATNVSQPDPFVWLIGAGAATALAGQRFDLFPLTRPLLVIMGEVLGTEMI